MSEELVIIGDDKATELFQTEGGLDFVIEEVKAIVDNAYPDMRTEKSRGHTRKLAAKIASFKVRLDNIGKDLTTDWKEQAKKVDATRKHLRDELDALKVRARKPLTDWEDAEKERAAAHCDALDAIKALMVIDATAEVYAANLETARAIEEGEKWEEFALRAKQYKAEAIEFLEDAHAKAVEREAEKAELDRLRKEADERAQKERDDALRREGAEKAKEEVAATTHKVQATKAADTDHAAKVHREAKKSLMVLGLDEETAKEVVMAIVGKRIANVCMVY